MSHSFTKVWIHAIWATKNRTELIDSSIEKKVHNYIHDELIELGCSVRIINGMPDHVHVLFLLNPKKSISDVIRQAKGSSSHCINGENLILEKFAWQTGYAAFAVSESQLHVVFNYIKHQKQHHLKMNAQQEFDEFVKLHGFDNKPWGGKYKKYHNPQKHSPRFQPWAMFDEDCATIVGLLQINYKYRL